MIRNSVKPSRAEIIGGGIYLGISQQVLPLLLTLLVLIPGIGMSETGVNILFFLINFVTVVFLFRKFLWENFSPVRESPWNVLRWAGIGFVIYMVGNTMFGWMVPLIDPDFANINDAVIMDMVQSHYGLMTVGTVILVPVAEECFYRGLVFRGIYEKSPVLAYIASMVFFSLAHVLGYVTLMDFGTLVLSFIQYLPAGFALAWAYRRSGSLFASILIHMSVNQVGMLLMR